MNRSENHQDEKNLSVKSVKITKNFKNLKYHIFVIKHYFFLVFVMSIKVKIKNYLKKKNRNIKFKYQKFFFN